MLGEKRTGAVRAPDCCEVFVLEKGDLNQLKSEYSELRNVFKRVSSEQTRKMSELVLEGVIL